MPLYNTTIDGFGEIATNLPWSDLEEPQDEHMVHPPDNIAVSEELSPDKVAAIIQQRHEQRMALAVRLGSAVRPRTTEAV